MHSPSLRPLLSLVTFLAGSLVLGAAFEARGDGSGGSNAGGGSGGSNAGGGSGGSTGRVGGRDPCHPS